MNICLDTFKTEFITNNSRTVENELYLVMEFYVENKYNGDEKLLEILIIPVNRERN